MILFKYSSIKSILLCLCIASGQANTLFAHKESSYLPKISQLLACVSCLSFGIYAYKNIKNGLKKVWNYKNKTDQLLFFDKLGERFPESAKAPVHIPQVTNPFSPTGGLGSGLIADSFLTPERAKKAVQSSIKQSLSIGLGKAIASVASGFLLYRLSIK
jgi:hypothetical protein